MPALNRLWTQADARPRRSSILAGIYNFKNQNNLGIDCKPKHLKVFKNRTHLWLLNYHGSIKCDNILCRLIAIVLSERVRVLNLVIRITTNNMCVDETLRCELCKQKNLVWILCSREWTFVVRTSSWLLTTVSRFF